ncbi:MAG: hypothetical protein NTX74_08945 [Flavobacterium sp.]|nr:hypothetical protein [Flavobacterium sp.]
MKKSTKVRLILLGAVAVVASLSVYTCNHKDEEKQSKKQTKTKENFTFNKPFPGIDVPFETFVVQDPTQPQVLTSKRGSQLVIPANAFLDASRQPVTEKVELKFREFFSPLEFYVAGIPMEYDDEGKETVLESGGMIELNATAQQQAVFVNPANKIKVNLNSWTKSTDFNLYDFDKTTGRWIEKGKDSISVTSNVGDQIPIPRKPVLASNSAFEIKDDTGNFPEIYEYNHVLFEPVNPAQCKISDAQEMQVKPLQNGEYEVTSIKGIGAYQQTQKCTCYLAFKKGKDYNEAMRHYQKKYKKLLQKQDLIRQKWDDYWALIDKYRQDEVRKLNPIEKVIRTLELNSFGFTNCDYPTSYPSGGILPPNYVDESGARISLQNLVLVQLNSNTLFRYTGSVQYNPAAKNLIWGITKSGNLAYLKNEDIKKLNPHDKTQKITMHVHPKQLKSYEEIYKVIFD